ncbi:MAG TPA: hypothetical protein VGD67_02190 [Pseudonocardiaceae bacterium]
MSDELPAMCPACGACDSRTAFVDETTRGRLYGLASALGCQCQLAAIRRVARGRLRAGQRRLHFSNESERDRKAFLSAVVRTPVLGAFVTTTPGPSARSDCWAQLVPWLVTIGVVKLRIESIDGTEARDRRDIRMALDSKNLVGRLCYRHERPENEPMLWIADAIAWSVGKGGHWRERLGGVLLGP